MATYLTQRSGNWSDAAANPTSPWNGSGLASGLPLITDNVTVQAAHTLMLDTLSAVCALLTVSGVLQVNNAVSTKLRCNDGVSVEAGGNYVANVSADYSKTHELRLCASGVITTSTCGLHVKSGAHCTLKGFRKRRHTKLKTAVSVAGTSMVVNDATGWQAGDRVAVAMTNNISTVVQDDVFSSVSVTPGAGTEATLGNFNGSGAGFTYAHAAGAPVGNFSSNLVIGPDVARVGGFVRFSHAAAATRDIHDVLWDRLGDSTTFPIRGLYLDGTVATHAALTSYTEFASCANYDSRYPFGYLSTNQPVPMHDVAVWSTNVPEFVMTVGVASPYGHTFDDWCILRCSNSGGTRIRYLGSSSAQKLTLNRWQVGNSYDGLFTPGVDLELNDCDFWNDAYPIFTTSAMKMRANRCRFSTMFPGLTTQGPGFRPGAYGEAVFTDCEFNNTGLFPIAGELRGQPEGAVYKLVNRGRDNTVQEFYTAAGDLFRDNGVAKNAVSSIRFEPRSTRALPLVYEFDVFAQDGVPLRFLAQVQANAAFGTGTPVAVKFFVGETEIDSWTAPATTGQWELMDKTVTQNSGADTNITVKVIANPADKTTSACWISGLPLPPFVTAVRHYGFLFDETNPVRVVNPNVVADEATAAAYTGATLNTGTKRITFGAGTIDTFQEFYDYSQAWGAANVAQDMPLSLAGSALLLAAGWTVVDPPALTGTMAWAGTVELSAPGTYPLPLSGATLRMTAAGSYTLSDAQITGTLTLTNTSGGAVDIYLPAGTSVVNLGPNITVHLPIPTASVTINGVLAGSLVQLYDTLNDVELYCGTGPYAWSEPYAIDRAVRLRVAYCSGTAAKRFIDVNIGTITAASPALTYLVAQQDDTVYNVNAIDGSTVTGITIDDAAMRINISGTSLTWAQLYAYECYWLATPAGIRDEARVIEAVDPANYLFYAFRLRNVGLAPVTIAGGYGRDAATGTVAALIDAAGSTANIYPVPDHVVAYAAGAEATIATVQAGLSAQGYSIARAANLDAQISSRLAAAAYLAPDNGALATLLARLSAGRAAQLDLIALPMPADIARVNGVPVAGAGVPGDEWGPAP